MLNESQLGTTCDSAHSIFDNAARQLSQQCNSPDQSQVLRPDAVPNPIPGLIPQEQRSAWLGELAIDGPSAAASPQESSDSPAAVSTPETPLADSSPVTFLPADSPPVAWRWPAVMSGGALDHPVTPIAGFETPQNYYALRYKQAETAPLPLDQAAPTVQDNSLRQKYIVEAESGACSLAIAAWEIYLASCSRRTLFTTVVGLVAGLNLGRSVSKFSSAYDDYRRYETQATANPN